MSKRNRMRLGNRDMSLMRRARWPLTSFQRFESLWMPEPNSGCWLWLGTDSGEGYGSFFYEGRPQLAHRVSWQIHRGDLNGLWVLHHCDTRGCVNPDHLYLGTVKENSRDAIARNRIAPYLPRGETHPKARFTESVVRDIRSKYASGECNQVELAAQ